MHDDPRLDADAPCPQTEALASLFQEPLLEEPLLQPSAGHRLLSHLLRPCADCWRRLLELTPFFEGDAMPLGNALSMAVYSAALGLRGRPQARLALMRPWHRLDAFAASTSRLAFCRLLLHETLAVSIRPGGASPALVFEHTTRWLATTCAVPLRNAARRDLEALAAIYQACECLLRGDHPSMDCLMKTADEALQHGEGHHEPQVTYWTFKASAERVLAMQQGPREVHAHRAAEFLRLALRRLPVKDCAEQRAELLHDQAEIEMMLNKFEPARNMLARSATLLERLGDGAGPYLRSIVWLAQSHAEARWAALQTDATTRQRGQRQAQEFFDQAVQFGFLDSQELASEHCQLKTLLTP